MNSNQHPDRPIIGVLCSNRLISEGRFSIALEKYLLAVNQLSQCDTLLIPATPHNNNIANIIKRLDGILLPGGRTMVHPSAYNEAQQFKHHEFDLERDTVAFSIIRAAIELKIPLFAICRGMQEIVCALGGSLHQDLSTLSSTILNHRAPIAHTYEEKYLPTHHINICPGGILSEIFTPTETKPRTAVNSLHHQGVNKLPKSLQMEAYGDDGVIEAISGLDSSHWMLGVQWHPEWHEHIMPINSMIFNKFGVVCRDYLSKKIKQVPAN